MSFTHPKHFFRACLMVRPDYKELTNTEKEEMYKKFLLILNDFIKQCGAGKSIGPQT